MLLMVLMVKKLFYEKELQKANQKEFMIEKVIQKKAKCQMSNGKDIIIYLIVGLIKRMLRKMSQYFPRPYETSVLVNLSKLSNVIKNDVVKKTVYHKLVAKVNNVDISGFVLKSKYGTDKSNLKKKISDADKRFLILVDLLNKKTDYNVATTELEIKITSISGSATNSALNAIENEIPNVSNLVKKEKKNRL